MSSPDVTAPPALGVDDLQRYYLQEAKAAEGRAVDLERQAARERGRAEALQAALAWLQQRLAPPQEAPDDS